MNKILLSCLSLLFLAGIVFSQNPKEDGSYDLKAFLDAVAQKAKKTLIYDTSMTGRKVYISNIPWDKPEELHRLFLSVLEHSGHFLETVGNNQEIWKIKRNIQGPWTQTQTIYSLEELDKIKDKDQFVTMIIPIKYLSAKEIQSGLRALRFINPQGGNLCVMEGSESILITDFAPNVKRVYDVIQHLDKKVENSPIALEGQTIVLPLEEDRQIFLSVYECKNISLSFAKKDNSVLAHIDEGKQGIKLGMCPFIQEGSLYHFSIHVLNTGLAQCNIRIEAKSGKDSADLWGFTLSRFLQEGKTIRFSIDFQNLKKQPKTP
ncbi:MAG: hypothetical protein HUU50_03590 [Candidatus Brocadiae bacterium]|nr:hypothetical protein [Candidatus Brocadiia bacterium]